MSNDASHRQDIEYRYQIWRRSHVRDVSATLQDNQSLRPVLAIILESGIIYLTVLLMLLVTYMASSNAQIIGMEYPSLGPHGFV